VSGVCVVCVVGVFSVSVCSACIMPFVSVWNVFVRVSVCV